MADAVSGLRVLGVVLGIMASLPLITASYAENIKFDVCMGNGGGPSCASPKTIRYTCAEYRAIGGGGQATITTLGERYCKVYDANGQPKQMKYNVAVTYNVAGGECGWTLFTVNCIVD
jgi:hypothetical protein